jgi:hypothetical protein
MKPKSSWPIAASRLLLHAISQRSEFRTPDEQYRDKSTSKDDAENPKRQAHHHS